jgi:hypothetical protein
LKPNFCLFAGKDSKSSPFNGVIIHCLVVGWGRASHFGFSALAFGFGKNQMCLTVRWHFTLTHNLSCFIHLFDDDNKKM